MIACRSWKKQTNLQETMPFVHEAMSARRSCSCCSVHSEHPDNHCCGKCRRGRGHSENCFLRRASFPRRTLPPKDIMEQTPEPPANTPRREICRSSASRVETICVDEELANADNRLDDEVTTKRPNHVPRHILPEDFILCDEARPVLQALALCRDKK